MITQPINVFLVVWFSGVWVSPVGRMNPCTICTNDRPA
jgi:hypothetical protein